MRKGKAALAVLAMLLLCGQSPVMNGFPPGTFQSRAAIDKGAATSYTGPGDIVSGAIGWWGLRGYNAAYSGNVAQVCDTATNLICANITWSAGALVFPTIGGSLCDNSSNICDIATLYDQSGYGNAMTQSNYSLRPTLVVGTHPYLVFGNTSVLAVSTGPGSSQPWTISGVSYQSSNLGGDVLGQPNTNYGYAMTSNYSHNQVRFFAGALANVGSIADGSWHAIQFVANSASSVAYVDGTSNSISPSTGALGSSGGYAINGGYVDLLGQLGGIRFCEVGAWPSGFTSGNQSSMNSNQHTYWGF